MTYGVKEQDLLVVHQAICLFRYWPFDLVAVSQVVPVCFEEDMPEITCPVDIGVQGDGRLLSGCLCGLRQINDQRDLLGVSRKDREIDAFTEDGASGWQGESTAGGEMFFFLGHFDNGNYVYKKG